MPTNDELKILQAYPLDEKVARTKRRIKEWVHYFGINGVYIAFSGGKDSTVLLDIVRSIYPEIEAVFVNTGLEYPQVQKFVRTFDNVTVIYPEMKFNEVISRYGYPFISKEIAQCIAGARTSLLKGKTDVQRIKQLEGTWTDKDGNISMFNYPKYKPLLDVDFLVSHECCNVMKKQPAHNFTKLTGKVGMTAQMAEESKLRKQQWLQRGCNSFETKVPVSNPMSFWTEQDILQYIYRNHTKLVSLYGKIVLKDIKSSLIPITQKTMCNGKLCTTGCSRTGCIFCGFGAHRDEGESRFQRLKRTHPRQYDYCMDGGSYQWHGYVQVGDKLRYIDFINEDGSAMNKQEIEQYVQSHIKDENYHFQMLWKPTREGLGMAHCIDELNRLYGKDYIKY